MLSSSSSSSSSSGLIRFHRLLSILKHVLCTDFQFPNT